MAKQRDTDDVKQLKISTKLEWQTIRTVSKNLKELAKRKTRVFKKATVNKRHKRSLKAAANQ